MCTTMEGQNAIGGGGCRREMTLYICWGGLLEEGPAGKLRYQGEGRLCVVEGEHRCASSVANSGGGNGGGYKGLADVV